ncbi:MAG: MFS transporter [Planktomarina sp.]|jgi:UMF1 family MFS transporter|nr:MFS transporter [Planktomarina sp.]MDT2039454.1 MFS transporter [Planktomarina sp.]MDT2049415.1 MFS transporter [Planktomarina sp.]|tara:strand:- start:353 stop:1735 length:1383 start_codon:yes stop_codon:yes gene_type:complete
MSDAVGENINLKKRVRGWMMFDWATQPFYTLGLTFIFGPYFASVASDTFLNSGMDEATADASAQTIWSWGQAVAGLFVAVFGILAGAYADSTGKRMPWLWAASIIFVICTWMLWFMVPDGSAIWSSLIIFSIAFVAAEFALVFTNSVLPSLGGRKEVGKISGNGAALGYTGGILSLFIMLFFFFDDGGKTFIGLEPGFGLLDPENREGTRAVGPLISIWFIIFMVPYFMWVKEDTKPNQQGGFSKSMSELKASMLGMLKRPSLFSFMGAQMFYRDALNGLYAFGGVYAVLVLDWDLTQLGIFGIIGGISAALVTWISGKYDRKLGPKPVIYFHVWVLIFVSFCIIGMSRTSFYGIVLPVGSNLPDIIFYICGAAIGGSGGGIYAASRSMMVRHTNKARPTEAFGLFALAGKATAFLAPLLIGIFTYLLNDARLGFSPVIGLFILGMFLLRWVHPDGDQAD